MIRPAEFGRCLSRRRVITQGDRDEPPHLSRGSVRTRRLRRPSSTSSARSGAPDKALPIIDSLLKDNPGDPGMHADEVVAAAQRRSSTSRRSRPVKSSSRSTRASPRADYFNRSDRRRAVRQQRGRRSAACRESESEIPEGSELRDPARAELLQGRPTSAGAASRSSRDGHRSEEPESVAVHPGDSEPAEPAGQHARERAEGDRGRRPEGFTRCLAARGRPARR